jgi:hypothetical protein
MKKIRLSPSQLNLFNECPRCFWLHQNQKVHRPRGIFPSLPGGMDNVIKVYFDRYRERGKLPPEIDGQVDGELMPDTSVMNKWRNWRTGLNYQDEETGATLIGALDDCLVHKGKYIPLDYKTRGYDPKEGGEAFYQLQLDTYCLLLEVNDFPHPAYAYLVYYVPKEVSENGIVRFEITPKKVATDSENALTTFQNAVAVLHGPMPEPHGTCEYCAWIIANSDI